MKSFHDKVAAITGAGSGIGRALAVRLAAEGCHLALSDLDEATLGQTAALVAAAGPVRVTQAKVDVASRAEVFAWAADCARVHGKVNLVVNNAGVSLGSTVEKTTPEDFAWIVGVNFWGVVHGTQAFLPLLQASGDGHVVNLSSVFGLVAVPGQSAYNATKFAVRGYTECLRQELEITGAKVSATCVHPGGIKTNIARASRLRPSLQELGVSDLAATKVRFEQAFRTSADEAAAQILRAVRRDARRVLIGADAHALAWLQRLFPTGYSHLVKAIARRLLR